MRYSEKEQLARDAIVHALSRGGVLFVDPNDVPPHWLQKKACFVTLKKGGVLRGCIGNTEPFEELYKNIIRNALAAAFDDPRFPPLRSQELESLEIEVSVLTEPKNYSPKSVEDLLEFLGSNKPGLILEKDGRRALFLPQVWDEFKQPEEFLSHLCLKAGLQPLEWKDIRDTNFKFLVVSESSARGVF